MNPPPEATYDDVDALKAACKQHAAAHLYSVTTKRSDYKMGVLLLHCGKSAVHLSHHKMTNDVKEHVRTLSAAGVAPTQILTLICSKPSGEHVIARDVYNLKSGRLTRLTFTSTKVVQLTRRFGTVLTMDCTYKTNMFKMPLLHIVSFACTGATFTSAIVFLNAETIEDYEWALNTYKGFMGNYLPLAIVTDCELALMRATEIAFPVAHKMLWVMRTGTKDELQEKLVQIQTEWVRTQPRAVQYVLSWMQYKTYFVGAYVDKVSHFESSSSSRVSTGDMMTVVERRLILPSHNRRSGVILFTPTCSMTSLMLWTRLGVREVSSVTLIKIHLQFTIAKEHVGRKVRLQPDPCFETVMGLPLATTIYDLCAANQSLPMSAVHKQWWLALYLQTPIRCCCRRACHKPPANIINASGTKRL
ncbi:hypothetical protein CY35_14G006700 [Sphagnum magellanicum]|nr:hypothetical protein CY35_14G006700 [Sphagnum magellanicum]